MVLPVYNPYHSRSEGFPFISLANTSLFLKSSKNIVPNFCPLNLGIWYFISFSYKVWFNSTNFFFLNPSRFLFCLITPCHLLFQFSYINLIRISRTFAECTLVNFLNSLSCQICRILLFADDNPNFMIHFLTLPKCKDISSYGAIL